MPQFYIHFKMVKLSTIKTVGETNYGFTDEDLNNMTLAELEMFINNMIDTSMSYKDTNGTKYSESDKVSGFSEYTYGTYDSFKSNKSYWETQIINLQTEYNIAVANHNSFYALYMYWLGNEAYDPWFDLSEKQQLANLELVISNAKIALDNANSNYDTYDKLIEYYDALKPKARKIANSIFGNEQYGLKIKNIYTVYQTISDSARQVAHKLERLLSTKL